MSILKGRRLKHVLCVAALVLCGACYFYAILTAKYYAWNSCGPIQVLAHNDEVWLFVEVDKRVRHPGSGCDAPGVYPVGHLQEAIVLGPSGVSKRVRLPLTDGRCGVTFHPNLAFIYRDKGRFLLFAEQSRSVLASLYEWHDQRFSLMPLADAEAVVHSYKPQFLVGKPSSSLSELTRKDGWQYITGDHTFGSGFSFRALEHDFRFSIEQANLEFTVRIESDFFEEGRSPVLLKYPNDRRVLNREEYKALPREECGHQRQRAK